MILLTASHQQGNAGGFRSRHLPYLQRMGDKTSRTSNSLKPSACGRWAFFLTLE